MWKIKPDFVTFIIPTLGRKSLNKTIQSLIDLDDWNWRAIILFDGIEPIKIDCIDYLNDNHFIVKQIEKLGHAGLVRNQAFDLVDTTGTAFLDDDDFLKSSYISKLRMYATKQPELDIIIFTYNDIVNKNIQPPPGTRDFSYCHVGISFAVKTNFIRGTGVLFPPGGIEDVAFLDSCRKAGAKYLVTNDIQYFVGGRGVWR